MVFAVKGWKINKITSFTVGQTEALNNYVDYLNTDKTKSQGA